MNLSSSQAAQLATPAAAEPIIDIGRFASTPLALRPYEHVIVPEFVYPGVFDAIYKDYPSIGKPGSFPLETLQYGAGFARLIEELLAEPFRKAVEEKFSVSLEGRPTMVTVRGQSGQRDGNVHTDSESKIITLLLYLNPAWGDNEGGRLRLLNSNNLDDVATEVPPGAGTLLVFKRSDSSWHGHKPFYGIRRVVQLNWVTEEKFANRNIRRHKWSSFFKKFFAPAEY